MGRKQLGEQGIIKVFATNGLQDDQRSRTGAETKKGDGQVIATCGDPKTLRSEMSTGVSVAVARRCPWRDGVKVWQGGNHKQNGQKVAPAVRGGGVADAQKNKVSYKRISRKLKSTGGAASTLSNPNQGRAIKGQANVRQKDGKVGNRGDGNSPHN